MRRLVLPVAVISLFAGACSALGTFGAPVTISAAGLVGQNADFPQVAVGPDGATTVVWYRFDGSHSIIQTATRPAGSSTFSAAVNLSAAGQDAYDPQVAVGPDGTTTIVWYRFDGSNDVIQAATRPVGASAFSAPVNLSAAGADAYDPQVAFGPDGATTVVWDRYDGSNYIVQARTRPAGSSTFAAPADLSATGRNASDPQVAVGPDGATTVVWWRSDGTHFIVQERTRPAGSSSFAAVVDLSAPGNSATKPQIAVGPDGATTVVWRRYDGSDYIVQERTRPAGSSTFAAAANLSATGQYAYDPRVAIGRGGDTTVVWRRSDGSNYIVQERTRQAGSPTFAAAVDLSAAGQDAYDAEVAVGPEDGATTIVWRRYSGTNYIVQERTRPGSASAFDAATDLSATGQDATNPQVSVAPDDAITVVWRRSNGTNKVIQASTSAPAIARLNVSRSGAGSGSVSSSPPGISCGTACAAYFPIGSSVTLTAVPAAGSAFAGWSGACTGTATSCTVAVSAPASVSAAFAVAGAGPAPAAPTVKVKKTTRTIGRSKVTLKSSLLVGEAGKITQNAVRRGGKKQTLCTASRKVNGPGTFSVTCTMGSKVRNQLRSGAIKYTLVTKITTASGASSSTSSSATLSKSR